MPILILEDIDFPFRGNEEGEVVKQALNVSAAGDDWMAKRRDETATPGGSTPGGLRIASIGPKSKPSDSEDVSSPTTMFRHLARPRLPKRNGRHS